MTEPKYKPIPFTAQMVRAILEGRKTQTRRIVKPGTWNPTSEEYSGEVKLIVAPGVVGLQAYFKHIDSDTWHGVKCPYGQPGDRLWVRESWRIGAWDENNGRFALDYCDGPRKKWITVPESTEDYLGEGVFEHYWMQCSDELSKKGILPDSDGQYHWEPGKSPLRWRPSIHMPRWASRITLEITGVRVERLQDISEDDAIAEGGDRDCPIGHIPTYMKSPYKYCFDVVWNSINGPGSWEKNPWVWVVEFKRVED